jgi:hypothetical protein
MTGRAVAVLMVLAAAWPVAAGPPTDPPKKPAGQAGSTAAKDARKGQNKQTRPPNNLAVKAMRMVVEDAEFDEMPFEDFAEWLERKTKANVVVRWKILEKAGIERDYPIMLRQKNIRIKKLLRLVFGQLTEDLKSVELAASAEGNTLIISTRKDINTKLLVRVYDVQELLLVVPNFAGTGISDVGDMRRRGARFGKSRSRGREDKLPEEPVDRVIGMITQVIQPLSWKVNGGRGTIVQYKGRLVIRNNVVVHQELAAMLGGPDKKQ